MKKYFWILLVLLFSFASCGKKDNNENQGNDEPPVHQETEEERIQRLLDDDPDAETFRIYFNLMDGSDFEDTYVEVDLLKKAVKIEDPAKDGYIFAGWYVDKQYSAKYDFSQQTVCSAIVYAKWDVYSGPDYTYILDEYVPNVITGNLELPQTIENLKGVMLSWKSSDEITLSNKGFVNPGREDINLTMTLDVYDTVNGNTQYIKDVTVSGINFSPITRGKAIFGYYSTWNFNGYTEEQLMIDVINLSFAYLTPSGQINTQSITSTFTQFMQARQAGVRVVLSIKEGPSEGTGYFSALSKTEEGRKTIASNIVKVIEKYHYDGIDIDWEYPGWATTATDRHSEAAIYTLLMQEIYTQVKAANSDYLVTAAIPGGSEGWQRYDFADVNPYLDYVHIMTYDLEASSKVYHHAALYSNVGKGTMTQGAANDSVAIFLWKGFDYDKLVIGVAFYGKWTTPSSSTKGGLGGDSANGKYKTLTYTTIANNYLSRVKTGEVIEYFDDICYANYLYDTVNNQFITYDSPKSIIAKCKYVRNQTISGVENRGANEVRVNSLDEPLGGIMVWELGEDQVGTLMHAVLEGMKRI